MKKKILFVYPELMYGGSTTSLITLLNTINYEKYEVDLILYRNRGDFINEIPAQVNILPEASMYNSTNVFIKIKKYFKFIYSGFFLKAIYLNITSNKKIGFNQQIMAKFQSSISKDLNKEYAVAIGFLELWANEYTMQKVNASNKILWVHVDYTNAGFIRKLDIELFRKADRIVTVSKSCLYNFKNTFPEFREKTIFMENINSKEYIENNATKEISLYNYTGLKLVTVCRLAIKTKGIDRSIMAAKLLREEGYEFKWFIVGEGEDRKRIEDLITEYKLNETIILLGSKKNPYPYIKESDVYVMASRNEGKPMSVTEAQILGVPIIITNFASAKEQVIQGKDGIIVDNEDDAIYYGIKKVLDNPELLIKFRENLRKRKFSNEEIINEFYSIIEEK